MYKIFDAKTMLTKAFATGQFSDKRKDKNYIENIIYRYTIGKTHFFQNVITHQEFRLKFEM